MIHPACCHDREFKLLPAPQWARALCALGLFALLAPAQALFAQDETVNGNLEVTGTLDVSGNQLTLGTQAGTYGAGFFYFDQNTDTFSFRLNRPISSWLWEYQSTTALIAAMRLDASHNLLLYASDGSTAGLTFNPSTNTILFGDVSLYRSAAGILRTSGGIVVDGAFTSTGYTTTSGSISGGSSGLTLSAGGTDQSVNINPSGTGNVHIGTSGSTGSVQLGNATVATFSGDLRPHLHNAYDLGQTALRWRAAYVQGLTATGSLVVDTGSISGGTSGLSLNAGGTDQHLTLSASGTGEVRSLSAVRVAKSGAVLARFVRTDTDPAGSGLTVAADDDGPMLETQEAHNLRFVINAAEAGRFASTGNLLLGTLADAANGRVQLAEHSSAAGGIGFGSDTALYRSAAATLKTEGRIIATAGARFDGPVRIAPQGDLSMGEFTSEPQP